MLQLSFYFNRIQLTNLFQVLVGITKHGKGKIVDDFDLKNLLHADSLSIFVNILNDVSLRASIYASSISLLSGLGNNNSILFSEKCNGHIVLLFSITEGSDTVIALFDICHSEQKICLNSLTSCMRNSSW